MTSQGLLLQFISLRTRKSKSEQLRTTERYGNVEEPAEIKMSLGEGVTGVNATGFGALYRLVTICAVSCGVSSGESSSLGGTIKPSLLPRPSW